MSSAVGPSAASEEVLVRRDNGILIVTISRPRQRNAVNGAVSAGLARALDLLDRESELRAGVLHGAGPAFCAGMDLKAFAAGEQIRDPARGFGGIVERPPAKPLIAAVEGRALGGGFEIVLACDMVTAGKGARFGLPEARFQRQQAYLEPVFASQDAAEGVAAFRERREPVWQDK